MVSESVVTCDGQAVEDVAGDGKANAQLPDGLKLGDEGGEHDCAIVASRNVNGFAEEICKPRFICQDSSKSSRWR